MISISAALLFAALAQESGKTVDLAPPTILDLQFKITDLSGNPVSEVAGTVQDLQVKEIGNEVRSISTLTSSSISTKPTSSPKPKRRCAKPPRSSRSAQKGRCRSTDTPIRKATMPTT